MIIRTLGEQIDPRRTRKGIWGKERKGGTIQSTLQIRRQSHQICRVARSATKFSLHLNPGRRGKLRILQGKNTGWGVRRIISRRNVKDIKMNVISGDNLKNLLKDTSKTDNIGHEVIKKPKPSRAGKTRANVYEIKFINVAKTNIDTR